MERPLRASMPVGTKASRPTLAPLLVSRPRLESRLLDGERSPVTVVCGPPGAGKTTLAATALGPAGDEGQMGWLSLDRRDNDPWRLATLVRSVLLGAVDLPRDLGVPADLLDDLFDRLAARSAPPSQVLVLDDVHHIDDPAALAALDHLLACAPTQLHLVLACRADPAVGFDRLRLEGRLAEVRHDELAFTPAETADLMAAHGVALGADEAQALWARTEGWPAGLRLVACALQGEDDPGRFVRNPRQIESVVADYLRHELLAHMDEASQQFLLRTSVADELTDEIAELVSGDPQSGRRLEDLARQGVVLADPAGGTYRHHSLFGTLLRARLQRQDADLACELHGRLAQWYLARDGTRPAERHAQAAGDWSTLARLVAWRWLDATVEGRADAEAAAPPQLRSTIVVQHAGLAVVAAAAACARSDREEAELYRDALDEILAARPVPAGPLAETWDDERLVLDVLFGCAFGHDERARAAAATLGQVPPGDPAAAALRRFGALRGAELALDAGELDTAAARLVQLEESGGTGWIPVEATALLALLDAASGRVAQADDRLACWARAATELGSSAPSLGPHAARLAQVLVRAQRGEQRSARETLAAAAGTPPPDVASHALRMADRAVRAAVAAPPLRAMALDSATARHPLADLALVALGVVEVAGSDGRLVPTGGPGERALADARARLAAGELRQADRPLGPWLASAADPPGTAHPRTLVEMAVLAGLAACARGDRVEAHRWANDALDLVETHGIVAPLVQHGPPVANLLSRNLPDCGRRMGAALELVDRLRQPGPGTGGLVEHLTEREMEVLTHLPTLMSNTEIADGLHLSVNTVKTHLKSVYRKLGVEGRRQAVARGRELELI